MKRYLIFISNNLLHFIFFLVVILILGKGNYKNENCSLGFNGFLEVILLFSTGELQVNYICPKAISSSVSVQVSV